MDTITINFKASGQNLTADAHPQRYASNTVNYIQAVFDLDENWQSFDSVRAVWHNDFACISTVLDSDGACTVPHEVLTNLDEVIVNLVGSNVEGEELVDRMTTYPLRVVIIDAHARICGTETAEVTPSQFEQYIAIVEQIVGTVKDIDHTELTDDYCLIIYYSDGTNSGKLGPIRGATGATGNGIVSAVLNADYTLTLTYDNGDSDTVGPIRGEQGETGNGIQSVYLTETHGAVKTYTILFTDGTTTTFDVTDGEVTNAALTAILADYAKVDGAYESMTVGNAEQLVSTVFVEDEEPYIFRTSGGSADIGDREYDTIVGGTVAWNQLVANSGSVSVTVPSGHKYFSNIGGTKAIAISNGSAISATGGTDNIIDLTQMFGSTIADYIYDLEQGTAGAGVAWFKKLFPKSYYAYNAGELMSVQASSHNMVGFNAWDEEWELGYYGNDGEPVGSTKIIRGKNYIQVTPSTTYYLRTNAQTMYVCQYDADKNFIQRNSFADEVITLSANTHYIRMNMTSAYGTTYKNDICINLSWDGERDGEYEAYVKHSYALDSDLVLRGIPKLDNGNLYYDGDTYESDGTVTRKYGIVDLGTLTYTKYSDDVFYAVVSGKNNGFGNVLCSKYPTAPHAGVGNLQDKQIVGENGGKAVYIKDSALSGYTIAQVKTAMSGVYLVYELATPTTETADPYTNPQIVDDFGTEEYVVTEQSGVAVPVGHKTKYTNNLRAKLEMMPESPSGNGDYLVRQTSGINEYVQFVPELPTKPSTNGTYVLKATVSGGVASLSWVEE